MTQIRPDWHRISQIDAAITQACRAHLIKLSADDIAMLARAVDRVLRCTTDITGGQEKGAA